MSPIWIAADWGTTHLRVWAMGPEGAGEARQSADGMAGLAPGDFAPALARLTEGWGEVPVIACGMVGAREGWREAPYRPVPCTPLDPASSVTVGRVRILPGLSQAQPADVMRGEETLIAGLLADAPDFDGVLCFPGTHTKWVHVSAGEVVSFRTVMTGELFALLAERSVLRHVVGEEIDWDAFEAAVGEGQGAPGEVTARLFSLRARHLLEGPAPAAARARLSGLLIGAELTAVRPYWLGRRVVVAGGA
ncbi:MAG: 2-dehydro-3-deoxygalactonokinase, partial [Pseudomonadota bacterium]